ncbi:MAG: GTP cyclohydrolase II [Litoreibacter sp.]
MSLGPTLSERIARARADLRMGLPIVIGEDLVASAETLNPERLTLIQDGSAYLAITNRRAETLKARPYDGDLARILLPRDADLTWVQSMADPADDLRHPMKGPFNHLRDANSDVARAAIDLAKSARLLPAIIVCPTSGNKYSGLTELPLDDLQAELTKSSPLQRISDAKVPLQVSTASRVHVFRPADGGEEHYAIEIGEPNRAKPVLTRLHSACFTGDLIGSLKCDCGPQLRSALAQMGSEASGVLLYMNQEGRGIGLANKMRAYTLQDQGFDTVEANHRLGFEDDERDFRLGAEILRALRIDQVRLLTNNPAKVNMLSQQGISVTERVALKVGENIHNTEYLAIKAAKSGHIL